jgi:hypothetical protein
VRKARLWQILSGIGLLVAILLVVGACVLSQAPADTSLSAYAKDTQAAPALALPTLTSLPTAIAALVAPGETPAPTATLAPSATPEILQRVRLTVVGDLMLARSVNTECLKRDDFTWPYLETAFILQDADLTIGNLETPIVTGCPPKDIGMRFCADPRTVDGLSFAGFDVVSLANNHALNYDQAGLDETVKLLQDAHIDGLVDGAFAVYEINGMKIGIMTYDDTDWELPIEDTLAQVRYNSQQVDALIGYFHWGFENQPNASHWLTSPLAPAHRALQWGCELLLTG